MAQMRGRADHAGVPAPRRRPGSGCRTSSPCSARRSSTSTRSAAPWTPELRPQRHHPQATPWSSLRQRMWQSASPGNLFSGAPWRPRSSSSSFPAGSTGFSTRIADNELRVKVDTAATRRALMRGLPESRQPDHRGADPRRPHRRRGDADAGRDPLPPLRLSRPRHAPLPRRGRGRLRPPRRHPVERRAGAPAEPSPLKGALGSYEARRGEVAGRAGSSRSSPCGAGRKRRPGLPRDFSR